MDDIIVPKVTSQTVNGGSPPTIIVGENKAILFDEPLAGAEGINHSLMLWRMRWFFAIALVVWILLAILVTASVFYLTRNLVSLSLFSTLAPPIYLWHRFVRYLLPMDEKTFELKKMRIQMKSRSNKNSS